MQFLQQHGNRRKGPQKWGKQESQKTPGNGAGRWAHRQPWLLRQWRYLMAAAGFNVQGNSPGVTMRSARRLFMVVCGAAMLGGAPCGGVLAAAQPGETATSEAAAKDKAALAALQSYIGGWRGVGQVQRGSNKGAWTEQADWAWHFDKEHALITFAAPKAEHFTAGEIRATDQAGVYELLASQSADDKTKRRFTGELDDDGRLVFTAAKTDDDSAAPAPPTDAVSRITLRQVAGGDRLVVLLEKRLAAGDRYAQVAEIGYTRIGAQFAQGSSKPECVVTGGAGTIAVMHEGQTYFVCCTGCRELFEADPAGVLAEYKAKKAKGE